MAKRKSRKSSKKSASKAAKGQTIANHKYSGKDFRCYGKHVRAGKSTKKVARIFCGKAA